jgi:hypothetical protein
LISLLSLEVLQARSGCGAAGRFIKLDVEADRKTGGVRFVSSTPCSPGKVWLILIFEPHGGNARYNWPARGESHWPEPSFGKVQARWTCVRPAQN